MNLLNNLFNIDDIEIKKINKKYCMIFILFLVIVIILLLLKKNESYSNVYTVNDGKIVLLVEKERIADVKNNNKIMIGDIESDYSIKTIDSSEDVFLIGIQTNPVIQNISSGVYQINLGKERLFEYFIRIIKS